MCPVDRREGGGWEGESRDGCDGLKRGRRVARNIELKLERVNGKNDFSPTASLGDWEKIQGDHDQEPGVTLYEPSTQEISRAHASFVTASASASASAYPIYRAVPTCRSGLEPLQILLIVSSTRIAVAYAPSGLRTSLYYQSYRPSARMPLSSAAGIQEYRERGVVDFSTSRGCQVESEKHETEMSAFPTRQIYVRPQSPLSLSAFPAVQPQVFLPRQTSARAQKRLRHGIANLFL